MENEIIIATSENHSIERFDKLEKLAETTRQVSRNKRSANTLNGYASDWEDFSAWCNEHSLTALPASPHVVASYIADRAVNNWIGVSGKSKKPTAKPPLKLPTLLHRVWGIRFKHKENGYPFDASATEIADALDALRRGNTAKEERKTPLLLEDIRAISEQLTAIINDKESNPIKARTAIRDRCIFVLGFVTAMRRAEISALKMEDIAFVEQGAEIHIRQSKTGQRELVVPYGSNPLTCPIRCLKAWLLESGITEGALFSPINRHGHIGQNALTGYSIARIIQNHPHIKAKIASAKKTKEAVPSFAGHSLRAGFVTTAIKSGVPEDLIMAQTGHKKRDTLDKYIRRTNKWTDNAALRIGL